VELMNAERFYCEKAALIYYEEGIQSSVNVLDKGVGGMIKRKLSGESIFLIELLNTHRDAKKLALAGHSGLLPVNLKQIAGNSLICRGGSYVASSDKVDVDFKFNFTSFIGGTGLILQKLTGFCTVFLDAIGTPLILDVKAGDTIYVDEKSLICMTGMMEHQMSPHFSGTNLLGGEGISMLKVTGPGIVYLNSVNIHL
jgi:uncharacterized protein (AIM24 family)